MIEVRYSNDMQAHNRSEVEKYVDSLRWVLPGWLHLLRVNLITDGDERGCLACISVMHDYREATLEICCAWLDEPPAHKLKSIVHEFLHVHINVIADFTRVKFDALCPKDEASKFNESLRESLSERVEMVTHDLAKVLTDKFLK